MLWLFMYRLHELCAKPEACFETVERKEILHFGTVLQIAVEQFLCFLVYALVQDIAEFSHFMIQFIELIDVLKLLFPRCDLTVIQVVQNIICHLCRRSFCF